MNKVVVIALMVILVGGFFAFMSMEKDQGSDETLAPTNEAMTQDSSGTSEMVADNMLIQISNSLFNPSVITVQPGEVIVVENLDFMGHSVTSDTPGLFDTGVVASGETMTFTAPTTPGEYGYHCTPHPSMKGVIVVAE